MAPGYLSTVWNSSIPSSISTTSNRCPATLVRGKKNCGVPSADATSQHGVRNRHFLSFLLGHYAGRHAASSDCMRQHCPHRQTLPNRLIRLDCAELLKSSADHARSRAMTLRVTRPRNHRQQMRLLTMGASDSKSLPAIGFLTVVTIPDQGLVGGYLVLNAAARPLEFHCTTPVRANRAQEILYGPTLRPYLFGEQI